MAFIEVIFVTCNMVMIYLHGISHCMEAGSSCEVFLPVYQSTERGLTHDWRFHQHHCEDLKSSVG